MTDLMIFIWVIGWLFTSAAWMTDAIERHRPIAGAWCVLLCIFGWPCFLGIAWADHQ